ncbi:hypothetical protein HII31_10842 [Pseudocercospora fuligena]|uniref:Uncharacterized protein n=1 Tax=Pseudocercospora fuligena TaxID=685502 RepID=A0A8H6RCI5_9PEZI|nr:hypothetical protein HII31_10842 [Pseudocercospora fuligena]
MQFTLVFLGLVAAAFAFPEPTPVAEIEERQVIGGGIAGTAGPADGTAGGAINGPTGFVQGCIGGAFSSSGTTACFPVATAPAPTDTKSHEAAGNAAGTLGPLSASGFLDADGLCAGGQIGTNGFTTCLKPTSTA